MVAEGSGGGPRNPFSPVISSAPTTEIVNRFRGAILAGWLLPGQQLPPERRLAELLQVSRGSVRDAIRDLQADGLLEVRVGARGGTFVAVPGPDKVAERIIHMVALSGLTPVEITEARGLLEIGLLPLVCERRTEEDLEALEGLVEASQRALREGSHTFGLSVEFHIRLAVASHSAATALLVASLHEPLLRSMVAASVADPGMAPNGVDDHRALLEAVRDRDPARADRIMRHHLEMSFARLGSPRAFALRAP